MNVSRVVAHALSAFAAAAILGACSGAGGSQSPGFTPSGSGAPLVSNLSVNQSFDHRYPSLTGFPRPSVHRDLHKSWVSPDVRRAPRLLFISDADTYDVDIFTMPAMKLKGTLTGFDKPSGLCGDRHGNIWVVNDGNGQISQYSRTGTLLKTIDDQGYWPVGCAVNRRTDDLAVANIRTTNDAPGNLMVYPSGSDPGTPLTNPAQTEYYYPTYDKNGNLYVDGRGGSSNDVMISVCPAGTNSCSTLNISGATLNVPGGITWNRLANDLVVNDPECGGAWGTCLYSMTVSGSAATVTGTTSLDDATGGPCILDQGTMAPFNKYFAGGCIPKGSAAAAVARWKFPAGGNPTNSSTSVEYPVGAAISNK